MSTVYGVWVTLNYVFIALLDTLALLPWTLKLGHYQTDAILWRAGEWLCSIHSAIYARQKPRKSRLVTAASS